MTFMEILLLLVCVFAAAVGWLMAGVCNDIRKDGER